MDNCDTTEPSPPPPLQSLTPEPIIEKSNTYSHICNICGKGFNSGSALGGHKSSHNKKTRKIYNKLPSPRHTNTNTNTNTSNIISTHTHTNTNDLYSNKPSNIAME
eukprot:213722_1